MANPPFLVDLTPYFVTGYLSNISCRSLSPDNSAIHTVFLAVQTVLFMPCNVTVMPVSHSSFFPADSMITAMHVISLMPADITPSHFLIDPMILIL
jgi:hypothetical protein